MRKKGAAPKTVEEYLTGVPEPALSTLKKVHATIRSVVPKETTEAISYGMPAFKYKGRALVAYAAFKDHCSLFPMGSSVLDEFADDLTAFRVSKGTLHFPLDKPFPAGLLKKIVKARIRQNDARK